MLIQEPIKGATVIMPELQAQSTITPLQKESTPEECTLVYFSAGAHHIWQ